MATKSAAKKTAKKSSADNTANRAGVVPPKSDAAAGLRDLFVDSLKDIYWAEKALTKALPKMSKNASSPALKTAIDAHLQQTEGHVTRLEQVFDSIGEKAQAKKCEAMDGLLKEGKDIMESTEPGVVRDAGIISASQKVEHYEIATYGTLHAFAQILGEAEAAETLASTLQEEKDADSKLTEVAMSSINVEAEEKDDEGQRQPSSKSQPGKKAKK